MGRGRGRPKKCSSRKHIFKIQSNPFKIENTTQPEEMTDKFNENIKPASINNVEVAKKRRGRKKKELSSSSQGENAENSKDIIESPFIDSSENNSSSEPKIGEIDPQIEIQPKRINKKIRKPKNRGRRRNLRKRKFQNSSKISYRKRDNDYATSKIKIEEAFNNFNEKISHKKVIININFQNDSNKPQIEYNEDSQTNENDKIFLDNDEEISPNNKQNSGKTHFDEEVEPFISKSDNKNKETSLKDIDPALNFPNIEEKDSKEIHEENEIMSHKNIVNDMIQADLREKSFSKADDEIEGESSNNLINSRHDKIGVFESPDKDCKIEEESSKRTIPLIDENGIEESSKPKTNQEDEEINPHKEEDQIKASDSSDILNFDETNAISSNINKIKRIVRRKRGRKRGRKSKKIEELSMNQTEDQEPQQKESTKINDDSFNTTIIKRTIRKKRIRFGKVVTPLEKIITRLHTRESSKNLNPPKIEAHEPEALKIKTEENPQLEPKLLVEAVLKNIKNSLNGAELEALKDTDAYSYIKRRVGRPSKRFFDLKAKAEGQELYIKEMVKDKDGETKLNSNSTEISSEIKTLKKRGRGRPPRKISTRRDRTEEYCPNPTVKINTEKRNLEKRRCRLTNAKNNLAKTDDDDDIESDEKNCGNENEIEKKSKEERDQDTDSKNSEKNPEIESNPKRIIIKKENGIDNFSIKNADDVVDDVPKYIVSCLNPRETDVNQRLFKVSWQIREDGVLPKNSILSAEEIKTRFGKDILFDYYETCFMVISLKSK